jgi:transposase-like protein
MNPQQLFGWRKKAREEMAADAKATSSPDRGGACIPPAPAFVPVRIAATAPAGATSPPAAARLSCLMQLSPCSLNPAQLRSIADPRVGLVTG